MGVGGTGVRQTNISRRRNGSDTMGTGKIAPPLALEGRHVLCEVVAGTNFVGAARTRSICVGEVKQYKYNAHKSEPLM